MVFDSDGNFVKKVPMMKGLQILHISKDGYVLAKDVNEDDEVLKLLIYKLEITK